MYALATQILPCWSSVFLSGTNINIENWYNEFQAVSFIIGYHRCKARGDVADTEAE